MAGFTNQQVVLQPGIFSDSQKCGEKFLLRLDIDRLLAPCYEAMGKEAPKPRYGGWEAKGISGHILGHWLSAASNMYTITKNEEVKARIDHAVEVLASLQDEQGYVCGFPRSESFDKVFDHPDEFDVEGFTLAGWWVPWYTFHKIFAGLLDVYTLVGNALAFQVATKLADWVKAGTDRLNDEQMARMLLCEYGGMAESCVKMYELTGQKKYLDLSVRFAEKRIFLPLSQQRDELTGKHANTQIPKIIAAANLYNNTGDDYYRRVAEFFWNTVAHNRSYVIGGNSISEHFNPLGTEDLGPNTAETCNTYNMMKLTEFLFSWEQKADYIDYYERCLYNHILASQDPESGMKTYFVSLRPGHFKVYSDPEEAFWCCVGTGLENPFRYQRMIYYPVGDTLYVNLFIASSVNWEQKGIRLRMDTQFPYADHGTLTVTDADHVNATLKFRKPYWLAAEPSVSVNGEIAETEGEWISITRVWNTGDVISFTLPMQLSYYVARDDENKRAVMYGPIVLAGELGRENFPETDIVPGENQMNAYPCIEVPDFVMEDKTISCWLKPEDLGQLIFKTAPIAQPGNRSIVMKPFFAVHHVRYSVYWNIFNQSEYEKHLKSEKSLAERLEAVTIDLVKPNEQQSEVNHNLRRTENCTGGYSGLVNCAFREVRGEGFFSYDIDVGNGGNYLVLAYSTDDGEIWDVKNSVYRIFDIVLDGKVLATETLERKMPVKMVHKFYPLPQEVKGTVSLEFRSTAPNHAAGTVYEIRVLSEKLDLDE